MRLSAYILIIISFCPGLALSAEPFAMSYDVHTKESIVDMKGKKYRKVEYQGDTFYLRLLESESSASDLEFSCQQGGDLKMENQILIATAVTKRTSLFVEGLKQTCKEMSSGHGHIEIDPNIQIGFMLNDSNKGIIKNKKIYWAPGSKMLGIGGEW